MIWGTTIFGNTYMSSLDFENKNYRLRLVRVGGFYQKKLLSCKAVVVLTSHSGGAWCHLFRIGIAEFGGIQVAPVEMIYLKKKNENMDQIF